MLDIGWPELLLIGIVTLLVVGPKELPRVLRTVMNVVRKARGMAREFQSSLDDIAREADLEDIKNDLTQATSGDFGTEIENTIDPTGSVGDLFRGDPMADLNSEDESPARDDAASPTAPDGPIPPIAPPEEIEAEAEPEPGAEPALEPEQAKA